MTKHLALLGCVGVLMCAASGPALAQSPALAPAQTAHPAVRAGYQPARASDGHPDLSGVWTNATTTPLTRPATYGDRLVLSDDEVAKLEGETTKRNERQNARTSEQLQKDWSKVGLKPDTLDECRSGSTGAACGYNAFWTDPGDLVMRVNGQGRTSLVTYPANGRMPARVARPAGAAAVVEASEESGGAGRNDNPEERGLGERCIYMAGPSGPVMTHTLYNNNYQFVQTKDHVAIWVEMIHELRIVPLNTKHRTDGVRPWGGDSIGWWDGDTLVVETVGYNPEQGVRGGGPRLKTTERFTRVAPDRLHYAFNVEDPDTWVEPWGGEYEFAGVKGNVYEYACHEGNYGLTGILAGGRSADRAKAAAGGSRRP
ncbi:MAG TPA: hypothetical protein VGO52_06830 [Hyphomonadaceae bacterium]|nr:hypothetical protein [Hyphomonadaceae bacterium]